MGGRHSVEVAAKSRQQPDDTALDQYADRELDDDIAPEDHTGELVE